MKYPIVYVEFDDHQSATEWRFANEVLHAPLHCLAIGWLYKEDDKGITLISSENEDQVGNMFYILKSCITKYKVLRNVSASKKRRVKTKSEEIKTPTQSQTSVL